MKILHQSSLQKGLTRAFQSLKAVLIYENPPLGSVPYQPESSLPCIHLLPLETVLHSSCQQLLVVLGKSPGSWLLLLGVLRRPGTQGLLLLTVPRKGPSTMLPWQGGPGLLLLLCSPREGPGAGLPQPQSGGSQSCWRWMEVEDKAVTPVRRLDLALGWGPGVWGLLGR